MDKVEVYYNDKRDTLQLVVNGNLRLHEEKLSMFDTLSYFGDIDTIEELSNVGIESVVKGYENIRKACGETVFDNYFNMFRDEPIQGKLILRGNIK